MIAHSNSYIGAEGSSGTNTGVEGASNSGIGVIGDSQSYFGGAFESATGYGAIGFTASGPAGVEAFGDAVMSPTNPASGGSNALYAENNNTLSTIVGYNRKASGNLLNLSNSGGGIIIGDSAGNLLMTGKIFTAGTCSVGCAAARRVAEYTPRASTPTMEDVGEAQMVGGQAYVRLDPAFANVIDTRTNYLVFVTPEGDSNGTYVTGKTAAGFVVRENKGGRSTLAFQYRIVAKPLGTNAARLPMVQMNAGQGLGGRSAVHIPTMPRMSAKMAQFMAQLRANPVPHIMRVPGPHPAIH